MAKITMREAISQALMEEMDRDPAVFLLGDVGRAVRGARNVVRPAHPGPHAEKIPLRREDLDALVGAIGDVKPAVRVDRDAVRQVKLALALAWRAP